MEDQTRSTKTNQKLVEREFYSMEGWQTNQTNYDEGPKTEGALVR